MGNEIEIVNTRWKSFLNTKQIYFWEKILIILWLYSFNIKELLNYTEYYLCKIHTIFIMSTQ